MTIHIAMLRQHLELKIVSKLHCIDTIDTRCQLANALTKKGASSKEPLHNILQKGILPI